MSIIFEEIKEPLLADFVEVRLCKEVVDYKTPIKYRYYKVIEPYIFNVALDKDLYPIHLDAVMEIIIKLKGERGDPPDCEIQLPEL